MNRTPRAWILSTVLLTACPPKGTPSSTLASPTAPSPLAGAPGSATYRGAWTGAFVAALPEQSARSEDTSADPCTQVDVATDGVWSGASLFAVGPKSRGLDDERDGDSLQQVSGTALARFCRITLAAGNGDPLDDDAIRILGEWGQASGTRIDAERADVLPQQSAEDGALDIGVRLKQTRALVGSPEVPPLTERTASPVAVFVADTEPSGGFGASSSGDYSHGRAIQAIIQDQLCGTAATCSLQLESELAMGFSFPGTLQGHTRQDVSTGGAHGTRTELAQAITRVTRRVQADRSETPVILNLSLGWNPGDTRQLSWTRILGTEDRDARLAELVTPTGPGGWTPRTTPGWGDLSVGDQAVLLALTGARCAGVLPLAATGNRTNLLSPKPELQDGALLPAAWVDLNPSTIKDLGSVCEAVGVDASTAHPWTWPGEPLVYAVSSVDQTNAPAAVHSRGSSNAPLVAPGVAITAPDRDPRNPARAHVVSGTSASTALTTAAAAAVWANNPKLTAHEVVELLHNTGSPVLDAKGNAVRADVGVKSFSTGADSRTVHLGCALGQGTGPSWSSCPAARDTTVPSASPVTDSGTAATVTATVDCSAAAAAPCDGRYGLTPDLVDPAVWPQPIQPTCPTCGLRLQDALPDVLEIQTTSIVQPFWRKVTFTNNHNITGAYLEVTSGLGVVSILTLDASQIKDNSVMSLQVSGLPGVVRNANLVLEEAGTLITRSWNVPLPVTLSP